MVGSLQMANGHIAVHDTTFPHETWDHYTYSQFNWHFQKIYNFMTQLKQRVIPTSAIAAVNFIDTSECLRDFPALT